MCRFSGDAKAGWGKVSKGELINRLIVGGEMGCVF